MTRTAIAIEDKDISEVDVLTFDYRRALNQLETLASAVVSVSVVTGTDATPEAILSAVAQCSGTYAMQKIVGGVVGCTYDIRCVAVTSGGRTLTVAAIMNVIEL